ncbi:hypothetical protein Taro_001513 [Colocasia esculenta]|uniref:Uncharacterized protein n=1 Tax=Colocasia esculenta TaxID=4460 RepID=A0A843TET3_COLES|nr:hypothetical protein [Colocasia esculenta]
MWFLDLAVCPEFGVVLLVGPRPCGARGSSSWELGVGWVTEAAVAPCVVSSSESECCELLYLIHISLDYSSNPSGTSDPWVAVRTSGSLAGVREVRSSQAMTPSPHQDVPPHAPPRCNSCWRTNNRRRRRKRGLNPFALFSLPQERRREEGTKRMKKIP